MNEVIKLVERIRELEKLGTPEPWGWCYDGSSDWSIGAANDPQVDSVCELHRYHKPSCPDAPFITELRNHCKALCDIIEKQNEALKYYASSLANDDNLSNTNHVIWEKGKTAKEALSECESIASGGE